MSTKRPGFQTDNDLTFTVGAQPIAETELASMRFVMATIAPEWSVELQGICADDARLVLLPDGGDDANGPSFVISREAYGFRLDQVHWDRMTEVGVFKSLADMVSALRPRVAFCTAMIAPASVTLH
jgi:hypothetical protein